jgi:hypothetical protein
MIQFDPIEDALLYRKCVLFFMEFLMKDTLDILDNPFYSPFPESTVLIKGVEENDDWIVYMQASNEIRDQEGDIIEMGALKKARDYYLSHGVLSWNHMHKIKQDPKFIVGEPMAVEFTEKNETILKGKLYKKNDIAQSIWKNIQSGAKKLGASVGGGILHKSADKRVSTVIWDETAITHCPVNDGTLGNVQIVPFKEFMKALTAGSGIDASSFTGGRALTPESMQGATTSLIGSRSREEWREIFDTFAKAVAAGNLNNINELYDFGDNLGLDRDEIEAVRETVSKYFN